VLGANAVHAVAASDDAPRRLHPIVSGPHGDLQARPPSAAVGIRSTNVRSPKTSPVTELQPSRDRPPGGPGRAPPMSGSFVGPPHRNDAVPGRRRDSVTNGEARHHGGTSPATVARSAHD
jgi:hypothetical protein